VFLGGFGEPKQRPTFNVTERIRLNVQVALLIFVVAPLMVTPEFADHVCLAIAAMVPIWLVVRYDRTGVWIGAAVVWSTLTVAGVILSALDDTRAFAVVDSVWLLFGWIGGLLYGLLLLVLKRFVAWLLARFGTAPTPDSASHRLPSDGS